jgi:hypothetical protein
MEILSNQLGDETAALRSYLAFRKNVVQVVTAVSQSSYPDSKKALLLKWKPHFDQGLSVFLVSASANLISNFCNPEAKTALEFCEEEFKRDENDFDLDALLIDLEKELKSIEASTELEPKEKVLLLAAFKALIKTIQSFQFIGASGLREDAGLLIADFLCMAAELRSDAAKNSGRKLLESLSAVAKQVGVGIITNRLDHLVTNGNLGLPFF